jgi:hypothetical protein
VGDVGDADEYFLGAGGGPGQVGAAEGAAAYEVECRFQVCDAGTVLRALGESAFGELGEACPVAAGCGGEAVGAGAVAGEVGVSVGVGAQAVAEFGDAGLEGSVPDRGS